MSKKTIDYIQSIEDEDIFFDLFIISYIGTLGLYQINQSNNLLKLQLKKYRQVLNAISEDSIDVYYMIDSLYKRKRMTLSYAVDLISYFQMFRDPNFTLASKEPEIKELLKKMPNAVYRRCSGQIKFIFKAYVNDVMNLTQTVNKFYSYCKREGIDTIDFMRFARVMKRKDTTPDEVELKEKFVTAEKNITRWGGRDSYVEIFKNPSLSELKSIEAYSRGLITKSGDLYVMSIKDGSGTHTDIIEWCIKNNIIERDPFFDNWHRLEDPLLFHFMCVQRFEKSNKWYWAESYFKSMMSKIPNSVMDEYDKNFESNNPSLKIIRTGI